MPLLSRINLSNWTNLNPWNATTNTTTATTKHSSTHCRSDIQTDLKYARWSELKHGRICMLAIVGIVVQQSGLHVPGEAYTNPDIFGAPASVGFAANLQIFLGMGAIEAATFNMHYGEGEPGEMGWEPKSWATMSESTKAARKEQEIVHCRLAMIAFTGAVVQTLLFGKPLLG